MVKVTLKNFQDMGRVADGSLAPDAVRAAEIEALADTGAINLAIPEDVAEALGVPVIDHHRVCVADGRSLELPFVGGIYVEVLGRFDITSALVIPRGAKALLGTVQLEMLDLVVVPGTGQVITNPAHPNGPEFALLGAA